MVQLSRLNNQSLIVNSDLIKFVEQAPDTLITLVNGEKFMVKESAEEVVRRIREFRRSVLQAAFPPWGNPTSQLPATEGDQLGAESQSKR